MKKLIARGGRHPYVVLNGKRWYISTYTGLPTKQAVEKVMRDNFPLTAIQDGYLTRVRKVDNLWYGYYRKLTR